MAVRVLEFLGLDPVSWRARSRFWFWFRLLLVASVVRGGWLAANGAALRNDPDTYRQLARSLLADGTFGYRLADGAAGLPRLQPTAYRPPLYPLALTAVGWADDVGSISVAILHWALGVATVLLVYRLSQAWGLGRWGLLAAILVALDPILLNQSSLVMTETLATTLAVLGLLCLTRSAAATQSWSPGFSLSEPPKAWTPAVAPLFSGAMVGLAALCRPTFLAWGAAMVVVRMVLPGASYRQKLWLLGSFVLAGGLVLAPWAVRNARVFDRFIVTTTHGGYTLWLGNNAEFYRFLDRARWGDVWDSRNLDEQYLRIRQQYGDNELLADRWAYDQAVASISREPASFLRACLFRVGSLWGLVPHRVASDESAAKRLARYAVGVWYVLIFTLVIAGVGSLGRRLCHPPWLGGLLLCLSFTAMHAVYWSNLRMRAPLMPVVCLVAAAGARWIVSRTLTSRAAGREAAFGHT